MIVLVLPVLAMRLDSSDAGNDPASTSSRHAFDLLAEGFGPGFNGPLLLVAELPSRNDAAALPALRALAASTPGVVAVTQPRIAPSGTLAVMNAYPFRDAFRVWVEAGMPAEFNLEIAAAGHATVTARWIRGQLWSCSDTLPSSLCVDLAIPVGSSYAQAARSLRI
jgi:hypothetical protein